MERRLREKGRQTRDGNFAPTVNPADIVPVARNSGSRLATIPQPSPFSGRQKDTGRKQGNPLDEGMDPHIISSPATKLMRMESDESVRAVAVEVLYYLPMFWSFMLIFV